MKFCLDEVKRAGEFG